MVIQKKIVVKNNYLMEINIIFFNRKQDYKYWTISGRSEIKVLKPNPGTKIFSGYCNPIHSKWLLDN